MTEGMTVVRDSKSPAIFASGRCAVERKPDGEFLVRNTLSLARYPAGVFETLKERAALHPNRILYRESDSKGIVDELTFGQAYTAARKIGRSFLDLGAGAERPVALICDNSIRMAIAILGCYAAGVPVAPISPSYSKVSSDFS